MLNVIPNKDKVRIFCINYFNTFLSKCQPKYIHKSRKTGINIQKFSERYLYGGSDKSTALLPVPVFQRGDAEMFFETANEVLTVGIAAFF